MDYAENIVIVGGGIGGLYAARHLSHLGYRNITLIEKQGELGGLLQNSVFETEKADTGTVEFDMGTHFVLKTGIDGLDNILDLDLREGFTEFKDSLPEGHYANGRLFTESGCLNINLYPQTLRSQIFDEISGLVDSQAICGDTLEEILETKYGDSATKSVLEPIYQKLTGSATDNLDPTVENTFFPSRLIVTDRENSIALKREAGWDARIAFASFRDSKSAIRKYYPNSGTAQKWVDNLIRSVANSGVKILKGTEPAEAEVYNGKLTCLRLSDGNELNCDYLFWTIPPIQLARLLRIEVPSKKPRMRSVSVFHFVSDQRAINGPFWINVLDPALKAFRITLYDNFSRMDATGNHRLSVEVLHDGLRRPIEIDPDEIFRELVTVGALPADAVCKWHGADFIPNGFPIMEPGDVSRYEEQINELANHIINAHVVSRFCGGTSGQMAIVSNLFNFISNHFSQKPHTQEH